jgi:hypothetical protein
LIAYEAPLYQVLALSSPAAAPARATGMEDLQRTLERVRAVFAEPATEKKKR